MPRIKSGVWTEDPAKRAPIGEKLRLEWMNYFPLLKKGAVGLDEEWTHFSTSLLALSFVDGDHIRADGSAVLIGPGLALAARHVFDPVIEEIMAGALAPFAASVTNEGVVLWRLHQIIKGATDVALLRLDLASDFPAEGLRFATLTTRTPSRGEPVMIAGARGEQPVEVGAPLGLSVRIAVGEVGEVYATGRDSAILPHPCVEVRCLTVGGMSGGPAFDKHGHLIGILSTSIGDDENGPSNVSLWWPTAGDPIESTWPRGFARLPTNLLELAKERGVMIARPETLGTIKEHDGRTTVTYSPWT